MKRHVLIFGLVGGLLIATLQYTEYRFVIIEHSVELYSALVAILFATFGIWLGLRITRSRETIREKVVVREVVAGSVRLLVAQRNSKEVQRFRCTVVFV
jgi:NarL family two-component system response regulator LiaR